MYEEQLKEIGLADNEIKIYLALLKNGAMNPLNIAKITELHRGYVYDSLERMQVKGIVTSLTINKKKHFQAVSPTKILDHMRLKITNFEEIIPKLNSLQKKLGEETSVEMYKGKKAYRYLFIDIVS